MIHPCLSFILRLCGSRAVIGALIFVLLGGVARTAEGSLTLAWDANPEPEVTGYRVYVGTQPGTYSQTYDVTAQETLFVYTGDTPGVTYYFAVAAIAGTIVGPRSVEVSGLGAPPNIWSVPDDVKPHDDVWSLFSFGRQKNVSRGGASLCTASKAYCFSATLLADGLGSVSSMTANEDGRLFFVEDHHRIRTLTPGHLLETALESDRIVSSVVVDPAFDTTRAVFVSEVEATSRGDNEAAIVRYRELAGSLGEGAAIISGLPLADAGAAPFTVGSDRRIYVALPSVSDSGRSSGYEGRVLWFDIDGRVPAQSAAGSPVLADGVEQPRAIQWAGSGPQLLLTGQRGNLSVFSNVTCQSAGLPTANCQLSNRLAERRESVTSIAFARASDVVGQEMFFADDAGHLHHGVIAPGGTVSSELLPFHDVGEAVSVAARAGGWYVAIRKRTAEGAVSHAIVQLQRVEAALR